MFDTQGITCSEANGRAYSHYPLFLRGTSVGFNFGATCLLLAAGEVSYAELYRIQLEEDGAKQTKRDWLPTPSARRHGGALLRVVKDPRTEVKNRMRSGLKAAGGKDAETSPTLNAIFATINDSSLELSERVARVERLTAEISASIGGDGFSYVHRGTGNILTFPTALPTAAPA